MKIILLFLSLFILPSPSSNSENLASFEIMLRRDGDKVKMKCTKGCFWTEIEFQLNDDPQQFVNSKGAFGNKWEAEKAETDFGFRVEPAKNGLVFISFKGTAWKELSYGNKPDKIMYLDERGISTTKVRQ